MRVMAVDPGTTKSAYVIYSHGVIMESGIYSNEIMLSILSATQVDHLIIEMVACYGMPVGKEVFETCVWIGRFIERHRISLFNSSFEFMYRKDVKMHLCNSMRAKDSNIRQAIIDHYPATGGGKTPQIGTKKQPGPLYGTKSDIWSALAVAITYWENKYPNERINHD